MPESACPKEEASDRVTSACAALPMANPSLTTVPWWTLPMCGDPVGHVAILYLGLDPWFASHLPEVRIVVPSPRTEQSHENRGPQPTDGAEPPPPLEALEPAPVGRGMRRSHRCLQLRSQGWVVVAGVC